MVSGSVAADSMCVLLIGVRRVGVACAVRLVGSMRLLLGLRPRTVRGPL